VSDGTAAGTSKIADVRIATFDFATPVFSNGRLFFASAAGQGAPYLWMSDGTAAGTLQLLDRGGRGIRDPYFLRSFAGQIFFTVGGEGALYQTDGTQAGTFKVLDLREPLFGPSVFELVPAGPRLFFRKWDRDHGSELWALEAE